MNSRWAIDPHNYHMLVVGDQGKGILFDARMGAVTKKHKQKPQGVISEDLLEKKQVHTKRVPVYSPEVSATTGNPEKWGVIKNWFTVHYFSRAEPHFVNNVQYSKAMCVFITSTNYGEVKLWDSQSCQPLGTINSRDFNPSLLFDYMERTRQERTLAENEKP